MDKNQTARPRRVASLAAILIALFGVLAVPRAVAQLESADADSGGEAAGAAGEPPVLLLFPTAELGTDPRRGEIAGVINDALRAGISRLPVVLRTSGEAPGRNRESRDAVAEARRQDASIAVLPTSFVSEREVILSVTALDVESERVVTGVFARSLIGVTIHNRIADAVGRLTADLELFLEESEETAEVSPIVLEVELFSADNGMSVDIAGIDHGGTVSEGSLVLPFIPYPVGTELALDKRLAGYHSERERVLLDKTRTVARLSPLWKQTRRSLHLNFTTGQLIGAGFGYREYLRPDYLYAGLNTYFYAQLSDQPGSTAVYHTDIGVTFGHYFIFAHDSPFRFALSAGGGVIFTRVSQSELPLYTDYYFNLLSLSLEWNTRSFMLYLRPAAKLALGLGNDTLGRGMISVGEGGPLLTLGLGWKL